MNVPRSNRAFCRADERRLSLGLWLGPVVAWALLQGTACALWKPEASFVASANAICADGNQQIAASWDALHSKSPQLSTDAKKDFVLNTFIPSVQKQMNEISNLEMSATTRAEIEAMIAGAESALTALETDPSLLFMEEDAANLFSGLDTYAGELGLTQCASNPLP